VSVPYHPEFGNIGLDMESHSTVLDTVVGPVVEVVLVVLVEVLLALHSLVTMYE
jgi:hypothetical protein